MVALAVDDAGAGENGERIADDTATPLPQSKTVDRQFPLPDVRRGLTSW
jgi:hypothetical protein